MHKGQRAAARLLAKRQAAAKAVEKASAAAPAAVGSSGDTRAAPTASATLAREAVPRGPLAVAFLGAAAMSGASAACLSGYVDDVYPAQVAASAMLLCAFGGAHWGRDDTGLAWLLGSIPVGVGVAAVVAPDAAEGCCIAMAGHASFAFVEGMHAPRVHRRLWFTKIRLGLTAATLLGLGVSTYAYIGDKAEDGGEAPEASDVA